jgi:hypothetical protein
VLFAPFGCSHLTALSAFCLSPTHHSHFKLLKTMKKLCSASGLTPSVFKGIYACVFLIFTTTLSFSQNSKWEFGVGLRPLTLKEEPYSLMVKRFLSRGVAVRFGVCALYSEKETKQIDRSFFSSNPDYLFRFEYSKIDRNLYTTAFLGLQYGKKNNNFYWYGATDLSLKYKSEIADLTEDTKLQQRNLNSGDYFSFENSHSKTTVFGIRQSFGIQYYINSTISVALEGGAYFERLFLKRATCYYYVGVSVDNPAQTAIVSCPDILEPYTLNSNEWGLSPLSMLTFYYHF